MSRPKVQPPFAPKHLADFPTGTCDVAAHLVETLASWRTATPRVDVNQCTGCLRCYLVCPEGTVSKIENNRVSIDYDFCKGCGICSHECKFDAITMIDGGTA
jgi:pyruvate ferredoxin oxidoreductase delta subunit